MRAIGNGGFSTPPEKGEFKAGVFAITSRREASGFEAVICCSLIRLNTWFFFL